MVGWLVFQEKWYGKEEGAVTNGPVEVTTASEGLGAGFDILMMGACRREEDVDVWIGAGLVM